MDWFKVALEGVNKLEEYIRSLNVERTKIHDMLNELTRIKTAIQLLEMEEEKSIDKVNNI